MATVSKGPVSFATLCVAILEFCHLVHGINETITGYTICNARRVPGSVVATYSEADELKCARRCLDSNLCNAASFSAKRDMNCDIFLIEGDIPDCKSLVYDSQSVAITLRGSPACSGNGLMSSAGKCICNRGASGNRCEKKCSQKPGYTCNPKTGSSYRLSETRMNWYTARDTCMSEGGHLLRIESEEERLAYIDTVLQPFFDAGGGQALLLDGTDENHTDLWLTGHNTTVPWLLWGRSEPGGGLEHCLAVNEVRDWKFGDVRCQSSFPFICEVD